MKYLRAIIVIFIAYISGSAMADETKTEIPSLKSLSAIVGAKGDDEQFKKILKNYKFSKNPKRENSWGSSFGVFLGLGNRGIQVGFRPPSESTNMPTYTGTLPRNLKAGDTIEEIEKKLGKPLKTNHDPKAYYEMVFEEVTIYTMRGKLFEVWLIPTKQKMENKSQ
jgi:hypothetical protein